jgi:hypothetical protein
LFLGEFIEYDAVYKREWILELEVFEEASTHSFVYKNTSSSLSE